MRKKNEFTELRKLTGLTIEELSKKLDYKSKQLHLWDTGESKPKGAVLKALENIIEDKALIGPQKKFKFIDLFAGIGGLRIGFEDCGGSCIFTSEWNKYSQQTYRANFQDKHSITGDITKVRTDQIPDHDVLLAGFPCQPFSIAGVSKKTSLGKQHGFACETQGTLFFDIVRILKDKRPAAFMLENVKNLQSHDQGKTFKIIMNTLINELGYYVSHTIIDAQHFLPQHRERIIIVGFRESVDFSWTDLCLREKGSVRLDSILHPEDGSETAENPYTLGKKAEINSKYILSDKLWNYLQNYAAKHKAKGNGFGFGLVTPNDVSRTLSARYYKDGSEILVFRGVGKNPRRLTPRECARLMGYNDNFHIPVSDTQAYKQFGNSVAIPVFKEVARIMQPCLVSIINKKSKFKKASCV